MSLLFFISSIHVEQHKNSIITTIYIIQMADLSFIKEKHISDYMHNLFIISLPPVLRVTVYHQ